MVGLLFNERIIKSVKQIGIIVKDMESCIKAWKDIGIGPWQTHQIGNGFTTDHKYNGNPKDEFKNKYALAMLGDIQIEIIELVGNDNGYYTDFMEKTGGGVHHLLINKGPDFDKYIEENGIKELQSFTILRHGKRIAYYDTFDLLGVILEVYVNEG